MKTSLSVIKRETATRAQACNLRYMENSIVSSTLHSLQPLLAQAAALCLKHCKSIQEVNSNYWLCHSKGTTKWKSIGLRVHSITGAPLLILSFGENNSPDVKAIDFKGKTKVVAKLRSMVIAKGEQPVEVTLA
jgi:hypothetical protein